MSPRWTHVTLPLLVCLPLVLLLPDTPAPLAPPVAHAASSPLEFLWSAQQASTTNSLAWGDVDGDGDLDLAVGNSGKPNQLYRNQGGTLTLDPAWNPAPQNTWKVAWGDVDNDGNLDLAVGNRDGATQLYRNQGGTMTLDSVWNPTPQPTISLAWGDVDGDGDLDLAVANVGNPNQLYRNQSGTLVLDSAWNPTPQLTISLAWGDVDGDGDLDLAVGNSGQSNQLYRNQAGTLTLDSAWVPLSQPTTSVAWGDVDSDGDLDLAVGNYHQASQLYRNQDGALVLDPLWTPASNWTSSLAWGDVDGDGDLDLVVGNVLTPSQLYRNQGGILTLDPDWNTVAQSTYDLAWGDIDSDGDLDLAIGTYGVNQVYRNQASTLARDPVWMPSLQDTRSLAWGDVDNDGDLDLAVGNKNQPNQLYRNQGGTLILDTTWTPGAKDTRSLAWGDMDNDGDLDLAVGNYAQPNQFYRNQNGTLVLDSSWFPVAHYTNSLAWGDVDGDGDLDLVVGNGDLNLAVGNARTLNQLYRNQGGTLILDSDWNPVAQTTTSLAWGDVDSDGDLDLVVGNKDTPNQIYRNQDGTLILDTTWNPVSQPTTSVAWGDVDGDGDLDLAVGNGDTSNQLYRNESGKLTLDPSWNPVPQITTSLAWGDVDSDGNLDLAVGGTTIQLYRNQGGVLVLDPVGFSSLTTWGLAWGDVDNDGDLDLVIGGNGQEWGQLYRNGTSGERSLPANPPTVAARRPDGAAASAGFYSSPRFIDSRQITLPFTLTDPEGDPVRVVRAEYSLDGGGRWLPALPTDPRDTVNLATLPERFPSNLVAPISIPDPGSITSTVTIAAPANGTGGSISDVDVELTLTHPAVGELSADLTAPDGTVVHLFTGVGGSGANMTGLILDDQTTTPISAGTAPFSGRFRPSGSLAALDGKSPTGQWSLRVADGTTPHTGALVAWALRIKTTGVHHDFVWDTFASGVFGQSDNVVVRLIAYPALTTGHNGTPLFQRPYAAATTFPFRVRGTQVRVIDDRQPPQPMPNAIVFRLNDTLPRDQQLFAPSSTAPAYTSDSLGYLPGRGTLALTDTLIALAPVPLPGPYSDAYSRTVRLYATNIITTPAGVSGFTVRQSGVQTVTVSLDHPLALFDLGVSVEWDARYDARFTAQLQADLARASELLFQASHGQAALGRVRIFYDRENWDLADIRIYASNRIRPSAMIGGVATPVITDPTTLNTVIYGLGQVHMGAIWNRFGSSNGNLSDDWPRTLVHELSHYLFFVEDNYLGLVQGQVVPVSTCPGLMGDLYASIWQYQTRAGWNPGCATTFSNQTTGRADWETITTFYPALRPPGLAVGTLPSGPIRLPLALTAIDAVDPLTPTTRLAVPIFYTVDDAGGRVIPALTARAYLFQHSHGESSSDYTQLTPLGRANNDQVLARGARVGDKICLFEPTAARFGCETIRAGREQLTLHHRPAWQPDIQVTPVNSITLDVMVTGLPPGTNVLTATLYPLNDDPQPDPATISDAGSGIYRGTFTLKYPLPNAYIHLETADRAPNGEPIWETVTNFAMDGNAGGYNRMGGGGYNRIGGGGYNRIGGGGYNRMGGGSFIRTGAAPVSSAEGDVQLVGTNLSFALGQFLLFQTTSSLPALPSWATLIGQGYRFTTSPAPNTPSLTGSVLSFSYLDSEVPAGEETGIQVYYRNPTASAWTPITTTLDTYFNLASIPTQGPGRYALMSSVHVSLPTAGWNMFSYPVAISREVGLALGSISDSYRIVYSHVPTDTLDPWKVYMPAPAPAWTNDLKQLSFGRGYWIYATQATDVLLKGGNTTTQARTEGALSLPPAVIYGVLNTEAGQPVEARIGDVVCGSSVTRDVGGQVGMVVKVAAMGPESPACGMPGSAITVTVAGRAVRTTTWNNTAAVDLAATVRVYLPLLHR